MLIDGIQLLGSSEASNFTIVSGSSLPVTGNNTGELFYLTTGTPGLYVYDGTQWSIVGTGGGGGTPGGSTTQVQFNDAGEFSGSSSFTFNSGTGVVSATGFSGSGASLTSLNASNLSSGTVGSARLGSGTASSSTYLRGDGTWSTVSAGSSNSLVGTSTFGAYNASTGVFAGVQGATEPWVTFTNMAGATDSKIALLHVSSSGNFIGEFVNDAGGASTPWLTVTRSATTATNFTVASSAITLNGAVTGTSFSGSGASLTSLNGSNISSGTVANARLAASGSTGQVQFNLSGAFSTSTNFTWDHTTDTFFATHLTGEGSGITALNASNLSSGTVGTARLGTGTANNTTYLRGDGTWATVSAGGASTSANNTWTAAQRGSVSALSYAATVTPNFDASNNFSLSLTGNATVANPTGTITPGQSGIIAISQDATGSRTVAWGTYFKAAGGVKPTLSTAPNAVDLISYYVVSPTMIFISANLAIA